MSYNNNTYSGFVMLADIATTTISTTMDQKPAGPNSLASDGSQRPLSSNDILIIVLICVLVPIFIIVVVTLVSLACFVSSFLIGYSHSHDF